MWHRRSIKPTAPGKHLVSLVDEKGQLKYGVWEHQKWGWNGQYQQTMLHWQEVNMDGFHCAGVPESYGEHLVKVRLANGQETLRVWVFSEQGWVPDEEGGCVVGWQLPEPHMPPFDREDGCALIAVDATKRNMRLENTRLYAAFTCHAGQVRVFESGIEIPQDEHPEYSFCGTQYAYIVPAMQKMYGPGDWTFVIKHSHKDRFGTGHHPYAVRLPAVRLPEG